MARYKLLNHELIKHRHVCPDCQHRLSRKRIDWDYSINGVVCKIEVPGFECSYCGIEIIEPNIVKLAKQTADQLYHAKLR
jgi:hypothetical protein